MKKQTSKRNGSASKQQDNLLGFDFYFLRSRRINNGQIGRVDVVPTDVGRTVEHYQCAATHVDRLHDSRESLKTLEFGHARFNDNEFVGVLFLQQLGLFKSSGHG